MVVPSFHRVISQRTKVLLEPEKSINLTQRRIFQASNLRLGTHCLTSLPEDPCWRFLHPEKFMLLARFESAYLGIIWQTYSILFCYLSILDTDIKNIKSSLHTKCTWKFLWHLFCWFCGSHESLQICSTKQSVSIPLTKLPQTSNLSFRNFQNLFF